MNHSLYFLSKAAASIMLLHFLLLLSPPASSSFTHHRRQHRHHPQPFAPPSLRGVLFVEKNRLGSRPPSCHNKCNQCHPCMAVQVPTMPSQDRVEPGMTRSMPMLFFDPSHHQGTNKYSNYKPLGWKCRCGDHFFNP